MVKDVVINIEHAQQIIDIEHALQILARLTIDWPGQAVGPYGIGRQVNQSDSQSPIIWFFNAEKEVVRFSGELDNNRPLFAFRSLNRIMKPSPGRERLSIAIANQVAESLTDLLPREIALIGGNCQGAPFAMSLANRLLELDHDVLSVATIDAIPNIAVPVPALLNFGAKSARRRNPFLRDYDQASKRAAALFPTYEQASLPCKHGHYFHPENIPALIGNIERFIGNRTTPEEFA